MSVHIAKKRGVAVIWALATSAWLCFSSSVALAQKPPPWLAEPPRDTSESWYGVGEGPDPEAARRGALRAVAARLRSVISGEVKSQVTDANGKVSRRDEIKVSEDVLKTEFSRVEIVNTAKSAVGFLVLVKVDKPTFLRDTRAQLDVLAKPIADAEATLQSGSALEQFIALRRVNPQIEQAINLSLLLSGAGAEADGRAGFARFSDLRQRSQQVASKMVFEVRTKPEDADIGRALAGLLADQGMRSATSRTAGANVLTVDSQARQDELFGDKLIKMKVRLAVMDEQGRAVASREHEISGGSRYDFRGARETAVNKLGAQMRDMGLMPALGFKE